MTEQKQSPDELIQTYLNTRERYNDLRAQIESVQVSLYARLQELQLINDPRIPALILQSLNDDDPILRRYAYTAIVSRRHFDEISDDDWEQETALYLPVLERRLKKGNETRAFANEISHLGRALAATGGITVVNILIQAMANETHLIRESARYGVLLLLQDDEAAFAICDKRP